MRADLAALHDVLDRTLACILAGDLAQLGQLAMATQDALNEIVVPASAADAEGLRRKAARNAACLHAAGRGLRAARRRMAEIAALSSATAVLATYDGGGRRAEHPLCTGPTLRRV